MSIAIDRRDVIYYVSTGFVGENNLIWAIAFWIVWYCQQARSHFGIVMLGIAIDRRDVACYVSTGLMKSNNFTQAIAFLMIGIASRRDRIWGYLVGYPIPTTGLMGDNNLIRAIAFRDCYAGHRD